MILNEYHSFINVVTHKRTQEFFQRSMKMKYLGREGGKNGILHPTAPKIAVKMRHLVGHVFPHVVHKKNTKKEVITFS